MKDQNKMSLPIGSIVRVLRYGYFAVVESNQDEYGNLAVRRLPCCPEDSMEIHNASRLKSINFFSQRDSEKFKQLRLKGLNQLIIS